ncbi:WSC domain-containing protein [Aspergillus puulaauensis]|uniref:WSC domain-containing protein n=1 Tax=Aspergillus puulaauensis TaxID=1220207 RepID=A0A7R7Y130_9EURO|nr:uncharacterized protein APUU_80497S [Aspergillus puulaauensis]BCS30194.1 hypothetical protein APUU_80497S [Aspergillus puulaauensis]
MKLTSAFKVLPFALLASASYKANYTGCFTKPGLLKSQGTFDFQGVYHCLAVCNDADFKYAAVQKDDCLCGNAVPEQADMTTDDECDSPCPGWPNDNCGGDDAWSVYFGRSGSKPDWLSSSSIAVTTSTSNEAATGTESAAESTSTSPPSEPTKSPSGSAPISSANVSTGASASPSASSMEPTSTPNTASRRRGLMF